MKKLLPILLSTIFYILSPIPHIHAQSVTLSVSPPVVEVLIAPGKKLIQNFVFKADGNDLAVIPEIHLARPSDSSGHIEIESDPYTPSSISLTISSNHELGKPVSLKNNELTFSLGLEAANVDVAEDVYLALVLKVVPDSKLSSASMTLPGISALILATINPSGVTPIDLSIESFDLPFLHDSAYPFTINPVLKNNLPIMIRPRGTYEVLDSHGKTIFSLPLYPNLILGESERTIAGMLKDSPTSLTWTPSWKNIGPYRLRLSITTEGGSKITEIEKPLWVLPIRGIILLLLGLILISIIVVRTMRKQNQKIS